MAVPRPTKLRSSAIRDLAALVGAGDPASEVCVTGVTLDSRAVLPGDLYAALPGARAHGADFAGQAAAAGAVAVLTDGAGIERMSAAGVSLPAVVVERPRTVLGAVCARVVGTDHLALRLVGITGTNGKTTTAYLVHSALTALGRHPGLIGTVETRIAEDRLDSVRTTPEAPELHAVLAVMEERGLDYCVMEVSSHALAQHRVDGVVYDVALFTNLSQDHLDFHAGMDDYFDAKASLFTPERARQGLVCIDDDWGRRMVARSGIPVTTIGTVGRRRLADRGRRGRPGRRSTSSARGRPPPQVVPARRLQRRQYGDGGGRLVLLGEDAGAVARRCSPTRTCRAGWRRFRPPRGSTRPRAVVDYAHTPDAIRTLRALRPMTPGRLVVVTGAGGDRDRDKRPLMGAAAAEGADVVVVTNDNPRSEDPATIRAAVLEGVEAARGGGREPAVLEVGDRRAAIAAAVEAVWDQGAAATVAVVGKGHENGQEIGGVVHPFDDRGEVAQALRRAAGEGAA